MVGNKKHISLYRLLDYYKYITTLSGYKLIIQYTRTSKWGVVRSGNRQVTYT